jgi:NTE family protein
MYTQQKMLFMQQERIIINAMKQQVSLVLSGGGARGMAHIGVIEELEKQGFEIFSISGTSMGALVGAVYALGKMEEYKKWLFTLDKMKVFKLVDFTLSSQGLIKGDKVLNTMKEFISDANIEDLPIYYAAVAADIINKKEVVFTKGSIYKAIRASISIPMVFTPVKTKDGLLLDGGVVNNIPISHAKRLPDDILVAVNVNADVPAKKTVLSKKENDAKELVYQKKIKEFYNHLKKINPLNHNESLGYFDLINKTINMMTYRMAQMSLEHYSPDILVNVSSESCSTYDFYKAEEMVEIGRNAAIESIKEYKKNKK